MASPIPARTNVVIDPPTIKTPRGCLRPHWTTLHLCPSYDARQCLLESVGLGVALGVELEDGVELDVSVGFRLGI